MSPLPALWRSEARSAADAVAGIKSGDRVFIHGAAATPTPLVEALCARKDLENVRVYHLHTNGPTPFAEWGYERSIRSVSLLTGAPRRADFPFGHFPALFVQHGEARRRAPATFPARRAWPLFAGHLLRRRQGRGRNSPPGRGRVQHPDAEHAWYNAVPFRQISAFTCTDRALHGHAPSVETEVEARIGQLVADLVEDGSTLQMGIGGIPDAALSRLHGKHDLGIHTEMFSDRVVDLVRSGAVTNRLKRVGQDRIITSFVNGSAKLFDFINDNPHVCFYPCDWTNDTSVIRKNPKFVAINSALAIDLTGQVCADSIGHRIYSGIGGQMDFIRGAALSPGGKPIIALPSRAMGGKVSRIVTQLPPGAGVVTTRGHVHWVITEYGAVNLHGKTLRERGEALVSIAHPDFRAELLRDLAQIRRFTFGQG
jgi:4-hydroxybutyrate CoA-transferase